MDDNRKKALSAALGQIEKQFGKGSVMRLGDSMATDILGAQAAKIPCALIDPFAHWEGLFGEIPRVSSVKAVIEAVLRRRP